jgi:hypothetical protein
MPVRHLVILALVLLCSAKARANSGTQASPPKPLDPVLSYSTYVRLPPGARYGEADAASSAANANGEVCVALSDATSGRLPSIAKLAANGSLVYQTELSVSLSLSSNNTNAVSGVAIDQPGNCYVALALVTLSGPTAAFVMKLNTTGQVVYSYQVPGNGSVTPRAIAADAAGEAYVSGTVAELDFPVVNAFQGTYGGGNSDGFLLKLSVDGSALLFSTYFGGSSDDSIDAMALDLSGNVVVVGGSSSANFPVLGTQMGSGPGAFIAKFTSSGALSSSTFFPGSGGALALDPTGAIYLASSTVITKVNSTASSIAYTYPVPSVVHPQAIAADSSGRAYVAGSIDNPHGPFPTVAPIQSAFQGRDNDAFVFTLDSSGTNLLFSSFLGGPGPLPGLPDNGQFASSVSLDSSGNIYLTGITGGAFPTVNAADGAYLPFATCYKDPEGGNCLTNYVFASKISPTPATVLALPSSVDFENVSTGSTSTTVPIPLENVGTADISLGAVQISGDFALTNNCPATLSVAASCLLDVTFTPQATGSRMGSIVVNDNASGPHTINLVGTGAASVTAFPSIVNFGDQPVGSRSSPQLINLTNSSFLFPAVTITSVQTTGDFFLDTFPNLVNSLPGDCSPLNPQTQCLIEVVFAPTATGVRSGTLTITDSDPSSPKVVTLSGVGTPGSPGSVSVSPMALAFGNQPIGGGSGSQSATITNGTQATITLSIAATGDFVQSNSCSGTLAAQATCSILVIFSPTAAGSRSGSLNITDSGSPSSLSVSLTGTGVATGSLGLAVAPGSTNSATVSAGQTATYSLVIGGTGSSGSLALSCSGAPAGATCGVPTTLNLQAATPTNFAVTINTTSRSLSSKDDRTDPLLLWASIVIGLFLGVRRPRIGFIACAILVCVLCGCGGSSTSSPRTPPPTTNPNGTPAGTYTITVTGTTSSATQSLQLTLVVN